MNILFFMLSNYKLFIIVNIEFNKNKILVVLFFIKVILIFVFFRSCIIWRNYYEEFLDGKIFC